MIKVKLLQKIVDKSGDSKRVFKSEQNIKKNKNYKRFINELSKSFSIQKNKFILIVLTHDEDEIPINNQEDLDSYLEDANKFVIILEQNESENKINKKENDNNKNTSRDKKEEDTITYMNILNQEIEKIIDNFKIPEIEDINDDIEFDINKYKNELNENSKKKFEDFKQIFETDITYMVSQKKNILKNNNSKFLLDTKNDLKKNLESVKEAESTIKKEFDNIIKESKEKDNTIKDLKKKLNPPKTLTMIKFAKEEIKLLLSIKKAKYFNIENIEISNIGNRTFTNLFFEIDTDRSSKDLLFYENNGNQSQHNLSLDGPFSRGKNLNNTVTFYIKYPKIGEYSIYIYLKESIDGDIFSLPLKITVKLIEDPIEKRKMQKEYKKDEEIKKSQDRQVENQKPKGRQILFQKSKERQIEFQNPKDRQIEIQKPKRIQIQQQEKEIIVKKNDYEDIDYKGLNKSDVNNMYYDLENELNLNSNFNKEEVICKIIEFNCDRDKTIKWIGDSY